MKKTQFDSNKVNHYRKSNEPQLSSPPKKQFQLLYRERDPEHSEQPYENIIFMKSKKCDNKSTTKRKSENKAKNVPVQELAEMVAHIQKQFKNQKQRQHRKMQDSAKENLLKAPTSAKNLFKNKEIKETFHSKASSRWMKYKKQEVLSTDIVKKYKNILSPSRNMKPKESQTLSSKFLKSTQETFRKEAKPKDKKKAKPTLSYKVVVSDQPEEYVLLENNFVQLTTENANLLNLKINSNKNVVENVKKAQVIYNNCCSQFQESEEWCSQLVNEVEQGEQQLSSKDEDEIHYESNMEVMQRYLVCKAKIIQRWWRSILSKKIKQLDPIVFREMIETEELDESMLFIRNNLTKELLGSEVSPIKMMETFKIMDKEDRFVQQNKSPFDQRESAAEEQLQTHLQLLDQLLTAKKITSEVYYQKKVLIEAKYQNEMQHIEQLKKIMQENTQRTYQITKKTQEDKNTLQNISAEIDQKTLDQIFGKDFCNEEQSSTNNNAFNVMPINYEMMIVNRQKSTGCHYDQEEKIKPSIYQKKAGQHQQYEEDFEDEDEQQENEHQMGQCSPQQSEYNNNFTQLLDQYKIRQQVKMEIDKRAAIQMGAIVQQIPEEIKNQYIGIDTSLSTIHRFILSFFKYYIFYYKDEFLRLINMPYGYNVEKRIKFLHGYDEDADYPEEDENGIIYGLETVISDELLDQFYEKIYDLSLPMSTAKRANFQFQKIHNRAVLDCFNEALNFFRPYFLINGPPYPWNTSEKALTFYFIAEENIQEVFEKTQFKVLKWGSTLCGIMVNKYQSPCGPIDAKMSVEEILEVYKNACHPDVAETREERLIKDEKVQIVSSNHEWSNFQEQTTIIQLQNSEFVFTKLIEELAIQFFLKESKGNESRMNFDFFQHLTEKEFEEYC